MRLLSGDRWFAEIGTKGAGTAVGDIDRGTRRYEITRQHTDEEGVRGRWRRAATVWVIPQRDEGRIAAVRQLRPTGKFASVVRARTESSRPRVRGSTSTLL